jgi:hypothetical protein
MWKLTRSKKISETSVIWSVVLVSVDRAAASPVQSSPSGPGWVSIVFALGWYGKLLYAPPRLDNAVSATGVKRCSGTAGDAKTGTHRSVANSASTSTVPSVSRQFPVTSHSFPISSSHSVLYSILYSDLHSSLHSDLHSELLVSSHLTFPVIRAPCCTGQSYRSGRQP